MSRWGDTPRRSARQLARAVGDGRSIGDALRHLDVHGSQPDAPILAKALAQTEPNPGAMAAYTFPRG